MSLVLGMTPKYNTRLFSQLFLGFFLVTVGSPDFAGLLLTGIHKNSFYIVRMGRARARAKAKVQESTLDCPVATVALRFAEV
jgi:hypothetical protein